MFVKFTKAVTAGRNAELEITAIVEGVDLRVSKQDVPGGVAAVSALMKSYKRDGAEALRKGLVIAKNAFGDSGLKAPVIDGFGLLCRRHNGTLDEKTAIEMLSKVNGSVNGLINAARRMREKTGQNLNCCIAAASIDVINRGLTGRRKLPSWFKDSD
jgi:hypothetical protein